jgi:hypothetical protein
MTNGIQFCAPRFATGARTLGLLLCTLLPVAPISAQPAMRRTAQFSAQQILAQVCGTEGVRAASDRSERAMVEWLNSRTAASGRCAPVERVANNPVWRRFKCTRNAEQWDCQLGGKALRMMVNGRATTVEFASDLNTWQAYQMMQAMAPRAVPMANMQQVAGTVAHCELSGDNSDPQVARMTLYCAGWRVIFAKVCVAAQCRYEAIDRMWVGKASDRSRREQRVYPTLAMRL